MENYDRKFDISVIIPIYNAEKYIGQCIDSILAQTKDRIEIIAVNDGCTDLTPSILTQYENSYDNFRVIHQANGGLAAARITGLTNARGAYIGWVDADDFIKPEMYSVLYKLAVENQADYVYCDYDFYPGKVALKGKWFKPFNGVKDWNYIDRNTQCWNTLASRKLLMDIDLCSLYKEFEEYAWISVMLHAKNVVSTNESLYYYRVGNDTMSGGSFKGKLKHFQKDVDMSSGLKKMLEGTEYKEELADYFDYRYIYTLLQLLIVAAVNKNKSVYRQTKISLFESKYQHNPYTKEILNHNHGKFKSFVLRKVIPSSYLMACTVTKLVFG